jgi:hypothetical protein
MMSLNESAAVAEGFKGAGAGVDFGSGGVAIFGSCARTRTEQVAISNRDKIIILELRINPFAKLVASG